MRDLPDAGAELVDAHEAVDGGVGGENPAERKGHVRNRFAWPREAGHEELRQARRQQQDGAFSGRVNQPPID